MFEPIAAGDLIALNTRVERSPGRLPVCQLPTSSGKLTVRLDRENACVYKGPYAERQLDLMADHMTRANLMRFFGDDAVPAMEAVVDAERGQRWLRMAHVHPPSLAAAPPPPADLEADGTNTHHGVVLVLPRRCQGVEQANHVGRRRMAHALDPLSWRIIQSLWLRFICWTGDTHLGNAVVSDLRSDGRYYACAMVDASENRMARETPLRASDTTVEFLMPKQQTSETGTLMREWTIRHREQLLSTMWLWQCRLAALPADRARAERLTLAMAHVRAL